MIKLIPCPKITKRELMTALMEGRRFTINEYGDPDYAIHWDDNFGDNPVRMGVKNWNFRGLCFLHEITESHWYDNIPEDNPAACRVWDRDETPTLALVCNRDGLGYFTCTAGDSWDYAELLTTKDLYQEPV